jgi:hypothetical protein
MWQPISVLIAGLLFLGGGTFINKGTAEIREDIASLKTSDVSQNDSIREMKDDLKFIRDTVTVMATKQGIKPVATTTLNK